MAFLLLVDIPSLAQLRSYAESLGPWFPLAFWAGYVVFTLFPVPRTFWTLAAGILFGPWWGLVLSLTALSASAGLTVYTLRRLTGGTVLSRLREPRVANLNQYLSKRGWMAVFGLRMVAGVPFSVVNYAVALTPIPLAQFVAATAIGSIPTTVLGVFFGNALTGDSNPALLVATAIIALCGVSIVVWDARRASHLIKPIG
ncbi:hypothetical protein CPHO_05985 [Corynebacterium phocae]|uniref:TVP38/TMEM64 family membrane protein n=1 Tax=Corynebacterium phocae TaxID=161895 RepID=A0A1L7D6N3_9CORY|nr:hypothetical protein CPHO_05985 [Corynebacterium phocae]